MKIHHLTVGEALHSLRSHTNGLTQDEAQRRLTEFGPNQVERIRRESLWLRFLKGFTHFFALILWIAAGLAFVAEVSDPGKGMAVLGIAILGVILINGLFSFWQEYRAERALAALEQLLPHKIKVLRNNHVQEIPTQRLVPGDILLLQEGDSVPADCRLIEAYDVRVNNATVTGESLPQARDIRPSTEEELIHSKNILLAGTAMVSGEARTLIFATGMHTEFGKIAHLTQTSGEILSPLQKEIIHVSRIVALLATGLGGVFFLIGRWIGLSFWENFIFAIGIIVANVPEGLLPTVTLALAMGSQRMAKRNALVRHLPAVETLGSATVICTDKTGTLTQNRMEVKQLFLGGKIFDAQITDESIKPNDYYAHFFAAALQCHNLKKTEVKNVLQWLGDPMEIALVQMAQRFLPQEPVHPRVDEIPFDTERKRMSTLHQTSEGLILYTKGALETLLPLCRQAQINGALHALTPELKADFLQTQEDMAERGLRVLAFAYKQVNQGYDKTVLEQDLILTGLAGLEDPPRPEVPAAMRKCKSAGIKVIMVTGDHPHTAKAIAREIGLVQSDNPVIITGDQLRRMSDTQLQLALDAPEILFARVGADQKMRIVTALKRKQEIVAVTGDGVNDAPALKKADIGIAMGVTGTDVAREAADMVLLDDNFASIIAAIEEGRTVYANIRKFLTYILTSNIPELVPYLAFVLFKIPLPLTVIQILAVDLGTDMVPALGLGSEKPDAGIMQRPPRPRHERLLNLPLLLRAYLFLGLLEAIAAMAAFFFVLHGAGWHYGQTLEHNGPLYLQATTACLSAIIVMQVINVFLCRHERDSVFAQGFFTNKLILWGIATEILLILLIDYTPWGNLLFGTAPIPVEVWLFVVPFALGMMVLEEIRKWWVRRKCLF